MIWLVNGLVAAVAVLHILFMGLEMLFWTKPKGTNGLTVSGYTLKKAQDTADLAANQGLYNGFLAAGLIWGLIQAVPGFAFQIKVFFLLCVIVAGVYGAASLRRPTILYFQALPAVAALIAVVWMGVSAP